MFLNSTLYKRGNFDEIHRVYRGQITRLELQFLLSLLSYYCHAKQPGYHKGYCQGVGGKSIHRLQSHERSSGYQSFHQTAGKGTSGQVEI
jgi:hypothetical protein